MSIQTKEAILSLHTRIAKRRATAVLARRSLNPIRRAMLAGKVKAYTDILCLLEDRYRSKIDFPTRPR